MKRPTEPSIKISQPRSALPSDPRRELLFWLIYPTLGSDIRFALAIGRAAVLEQGCFADSHQPRVRGHYAVGDVVIGLDQPRNGPSTVAATTIWNDLNDPRIDLMR
jgi:hypothetical protein